MNGKSQLFKNVSPSKRSYIGISSIISGIGFYFTISKTKSFARVELYIRSNNVAFEELKQQSAEICSLFGKSLIWEEMSKDFRVKFEKENVELKKQENWNGIISNLTDEMVKFYDALQPSLEKVKISLKS